MDLATCNLRGGLFVPQPSASASAMGVLFSVFYRGHVESNTSKLAIYIFRRQGWFLVAYGSHGAIDSLRVNTSNALTSWENLDRDRWAVFFFPRKGSFTGLLLSLGICIWAGLKCLPAADSSPGRLPQLRS